MSTSRACDLQFGFTTIELVVVLVLLGILSAYIVPKFSDRTSYDSLTVQQDIKQAARYAQQLAMAQTDKTAVALTTTSNAVAVTISGASVGAPYPLSMPSGVTLSPATTIVFDRLGTPSTGSTITISDTGGQNRLVTIEGTTGYAHE